LEKLVAPFDDPSVALAGGKLREGVLVSAADRWRQAHMPQDWGNERLLNPRFVFGNNVIVRKSVVEEVGWYKEEFRTNGEDSDISRRIRAKGYSTVYEPAARVTHLRQDTVRSVMATLYRWYWTGTDGMKLRSVLGRSFRLHFGTNIYEFVKTDLQKKNFDLLGLDLLTLLYMPYFDIRAFLRGFGATEPKLVCAEKKE
jgi:cellulose synthase/poly-beta-1,6-N-acetylglucosamine synthase-like glycosyltransferase